MRITALGVCTACLLLTALTTSTAAPATADDAALPNIEALTNREPDRWQGRHHYLYDDDYQPGTAATVGSAPADARACSNEPVRMRPSDGSTVVRRFRRCD